MQYRKWYYVVLLLALALSACAGPAETAAPPATPDESGAGAATAAPAESEAASGGEMATLNVMTHDSFAVSEDLIAGFEAQNNVKVNFIQAGDAGAALNRAILSKDSPLADVIYGVDNTFLSRALEADLFVPYASPALETIPDAFKLDPDNNLLPVDFGDVCINYDKAYFAEHDLALPQSLEDLTLPEYKGLLAVESPATSSPGLAFLMATIAHFGEDGYLQFWQQIRDNDAVVVNDWETAYYTNFSGSSGQGSQPMVVSYGSSPPAEVIYASEPLDDAPTASLVGPDMCYRQVEFVGILKGTQNQALAEKFVDFMLSVPFQEDMPLQMFVFPVQTDAQLPEAFDLYAQIPEQPAQLDPAQVAQNRDAWIEAWDEAVLR
ncbi:MAG: thiamine ABC transporter substrate-binding protein [Anaerolineaceae bacterium]|nr:thiamine ABC transporter substrate-binding protein [Anaerolineaceae bacterium]